MIDCTTKTENFFCHRHARTTAGQKQNLISRKAAKGKINVTVEQDVLVVPMERVSVARMATVKPQGWVHAALGMGGTSTSAPVLNSYKLI
ncbi:MAG: hypothetical protein GQ578_08340 [Desulfuromonadaceae bacterium]|nr:hypothetical protein [Desulfuromonadaceae bacterium]